jgi:hypothetical protein
MAEEIKEVKKDEDWMQKKWRPAMGWMYMMVCVFDFVIFPILWALVQFYETEAANDAFRQWSPLTLQGAGFFHMAMGAVLGISAYGRTQEKVAGVATTEPSPVNIAPAVQAPTPVPVSTVASVTTGFGGKTAPPPAAQPEI